MTNEQYQQKEGKEEIIAVDEDSYNEKREFDDDDDNEKNEQTTGEKIKETVITDKKFLQGAGVGFLAGAATGATITHYVDKKKNKKEENERAVEEKRRRKEEDKHRKAQLEEQKHELERIQKEHDKAQIEKQRQARERRRREAEAASRIAAPCVGMPTAVATMAYPPGVGQPPPPQVAQAYPSAQGGYVQYGGAPGYGQQPQYVGYGQQQQQQQPPPYPYGYGAAAPPPNYGYGYGQPQQRTVYVEDRRRRGMDPGMAMLGGFLVGDMLGGGF